MNTIGFCNSLNDLLKENGLKIIDNGNNDVRIIGTVALIIMIVICAVGMEWESKAQVRFDLLIYFMFVNYKLTLKLCFRTFLSPLLLEQFWTL